MIYMRHTCIVNVHTVDMKYCNMRNFFFFFTFLINMFYGVYEKQKNNLNSTRVGGKKKIKSNNNTENAL